MGAMARRSDQRPHRPALPLLDRNDALATLDALWHRAVAGHGQVVLVAGETGIGKTALVQAFLDRVRDQDHARLSVAVPPTSVPFAVWGRLAESDADLRARLPKPLGDREPQTRARDGLAREVTAALLDLGRMRPLIVVFEDVHLSDEASIHSIQMLAGAIGTAHLLLILTLRTPIPKESPARGLTATLLHEAVTTYLELGPIGFDAVRSLVDQSFATAPESERAGLAGDLIHLSGGNALFLTGLIGALLEPPVDPAMPLRERLRMLPSELRQIIMYHVGRLSPDAQETLQLAAVAGETIDLDVLADLEGRDAGLVLQDLEQALAVGLLVEGLDGETRFRHQIVQRTLEESLSLLRRRRLHASIAGILQRRPRALPIEVALHADLAHDYVTAVDAYTRAAEQAAQVFAMREGARYYERAVALAADAGLDDEKQDALALAYADSMATFDPEFGVRIIDQVIGRSLARGDRLTVARGRRRLAGFRYERGYRAEAMALLNQAIPALEAADDRLELLEALAILGYCVSSANAFSLLHSVAGRLFDLAREIGDRAHEAVAENLMAVARVAGGEPAGAAELARESMDVMIGLGRLDLATGYASVALWRVDVPSNLRRPDMVDGLLARAERIDQLGDDRLDLAPSACAVERSYGYFLGGEWDRVRARLATLPNPVEYSAPQVTKDRLHIIAAELALAEGRVDDAEALLAYIAPRSDAPFGDHAFEPWLHAARRRTEVRIATGDVDDAQRWIAAIDHALETQPHVPGDLMLGTVVGRLRVARGEIDAALAVLGPLVERADQTGNILVFLNALRLQSWALHRNGQHEASLAAATRAIEEAVACKLVYEEALSRLSWAQIAANLPDEHAAASAMLSRAVEAFERLGAIGALAAAQAIRARLVRSPARPFGLTGREVAVLRLIAHGLPDREIGERLFISPRTVSTHVSNMLSKVGVSNRVELAAWALRNHVLETDLSTMSPDGGSGRRRFPTESSRFGVTLIDLAVPII